MAPTTRAVGIDFGTSTSLAAEGDPVRGITLAPLGRSTTYMPTLLGVTNGPLLAGDSAADLPERQIIRSIKRQITERQTRIPHPLKSEEYLDVDDAIVTILRALASGARGFFDLDAEAVRLGCPAMWDAEQRTRLLSLAKKAGIPISEHSLIDEPIAAGMAWVSHRVRDHKERIRGRLLVFDMGGGTLDVALLQVDTTSGRLSGEISVLSSKGVNDAGDTLDRAIREDLLVMIEEMNLELDAASTAEIDRRLLMEARAAKEMLSSTDEALIQIPLQSGRMPVLKYTREQLESAFASQLDAAESLTWSVVRESHLTHEAHRSPMELRTMPQGEVAKGVSYVLLVGGMSQIPAVRRRLERMFPHAEFYSRVGARVAADEAIVAGLAETVAYDRVNLHRPSFDFFLELPDGSVRTLYTAHSPLYEWWMALQRNDLFFEKVIPARELPTQGTALLRVKSPMGTEVALRLDGSDRQGIPVGLGRQEVRFTIRPNGRICLWDGMDKGHAFRVDRWPVLRGADHAFIELERWTKALDTSPPLAWHQRDT